MQSTDIFHKFRMLWGSWRNKNILWIPSLIWSYVPVDKDQSAMLQFNQGRLLENVQYGGFLNETVKCLLILLMHKLIWASNVSIYSTGQVL